MRYSPYSYNMLSINETGVLQIQVLNNTDNRPVPQVIIRIAKVTYYGQYNEIVDGVVLAEFYTDDNGMITTNLPPLNELTTDNSFYVASLHHYRYHNAYIFNIQVYPNITSSYIAYLIPVTEEIERFRIVIQPTTRTIHEK